MRAIGPDVSLKAFTLLLALTAVCVRAGGASQPAAGAGGGGRGRGGDQTVPVTVATVVQKSMPIEIRVIGSVEAYSVVSVHAQITGQLTAVNFKEGDDVAKNQVLFALDRRPLEAALMAAQANLQRDIAQAANAKVVAQRYADLAARGIATHRTARDEPHEPPRRSTPRVEADKAAVENAKVQLQYATIASPIDGRTGALMVHEGNLVRAADLAPLVVINQVAPIYVSFAIPESRLAELKRFLALGHAAGRGEAAERRGPLVARPHHVRRQQRRSDDRHHPDQGDVHQRRPPAVAGPVRQRHRRAHERSDGGRRADGGRPGRPAGAVRLRRQG